MADDIVASLLAELGKAQGYKPTTTTVTTLKNKKRPRALLEELDGYPDNTRCVGNHSIWNPYVQVNTLPASSFLPVLPTNPQVEVIRRRAYEKFKQHFYDVVGRVSEQLKVKLQIPALLEKWQMDCKLFEYQHMVEKMEKGQSPRQNRRTLATTVEIHRLLMQERQQDEGTVTLPWMDPIILNKKASFNFAPAFLTEYKRAWRDVKRKDSGEDQLEQIVKGAKLSKKLQHMQKALHKFICEAKDYLETEIALAASRQSVQQTASSKHSKLPKISQDKEREQIQVTYNGLTFRVHLAHYEKLQRMFDRANKQRNFDDDNAISWEEAFFCLLCRYDTLQGAGLQASLPGAVMDVLLKHFDCRMECFASPLNCRNSNFCSAFDMDRLFGGVGSFFTSEFTSGCYQANPPFCEELIAGMHKKIQESLQKSEEPLMFVVFVPVWEDSKGYQSLVNVDKESLTKHVVFKSGRHWYAEGTQHRRKDSFRVASFDTSVFVYQNEAAHSKWPISDQAVAELNTAMTADPSMGDDYSNETSKTTAPKENTIELEAPDDAPSDLHEAGIEEKEHLADKSSTDAPLSKRKRRQSQQGKGKKQKWMENKEEGKAQLDLLKSLGLVQNEPSEEKVPVVSIEKETPNKQGKKSAKKRKGKKVKRQEP